jgi:uncharacterized hydrophobic protein (TIGR00271 family)
MTPVYDSVEFSRTQGILSAIALGGSVFLGVATFGAGSELIRQSGTDTPKVFFVATLLFLPIVFSCVQRSSAGVSNSTFYASARASGSPIRLFFSVWLMLGGYLALGSLLAYGAGLRAAVGLEKVFGWGVGTNIVVYLIIAAIFIIEFLTTGEGWRSRTAIFWACLAFLLALLISGPILHIRAGANIPKTEPLQHWLIAISMLAATLWSVDVVLNYRGQFREQNRTTIWSLVAIFAGGNVFCGLIALGVVRNPSLLLQNWLAVLTWNENRLELLILITGFLICISALFRVTTRIARLLGSMVIDATLPYLSKNKATTERTVRYYLLLTFLLLAYLATALSIRYLLMISAFPALLSLILYLHPLLKKDASRTVELRLPFHPLIPAISIVLCIFLIWILPLQNLFVGGIWLLAGSIIYVFYARKRIAPAMQQERVLADDGAKAASVKYCVLACLENGQINESLVRIGSALAAAKNGELLVLRILETSELMPGNLQRELGQNNWRQMQTQLQTLSLRQAPIPIVRMAPDPISGIKATAREFDADFVLFEWPDDPTERLRKNRLQSMLQLTARPLGILKGQVGDRLANLTIACGKSSHTTLALQLGEAIASSGNSKIEALRIFSKSQSFEDAKNVIEQAIQQSEIQISPEIVIHEDNDLEKGVLKKTVHSDLLLVGISDDPLSGLPLPDGQTIEIAQQRNRATLIVKSKEETSGFLMRRLLSQLTNRVTSLTPKERSELLVQLKVGLQASADFYLMVALAAAIAITGLIMNDGSIVLGAMLVSPLMSPIVGIACGITLGNLDLIRRSSASTFKGMAIVLGVGAIMTFILPSVGPTDQILSRTHPGIFDLLAALAAGAAGAYSLSKKPVAGALPGVAMSLSLEPPLATAGYGLSTSEFWITGGAILLFFTNLAAIVLSGVGVYLLLGMRPPRKEGLNVVWKAVASVVLATFALVVPLGLGTYGSVKKGHLKFQVESQFKDEALHERFQLLDLKISEQGDGFLIQPTVLSSQEVTPEKIEKFRKAVEERVDSPIQIEATILQTKQIESPHDHELKE